MKNKLKKQGSRVGVALGPKANIDSKLLLKNLRSMNAVLDRQQKRIHQLEQKVKRTVTDQASKNRRLEKALARITAVVTLTPEEKKRRMKLLRYARRIARKMEARYGKNTIAP